MAYPVNFSSMALRNFVIFVIFAILVGFVIFAVSSRVFHYHMCISLLLFVDGPVKFCNFPSFRNKFRIFLNFVAEFHPRFTSLLWLRGGHSFGKSADYRALFDRYLVVFVVSL